MNPIDEMDGIVDDFCIEADEMIELTTEDLLDIENEYSDEKINRIFRTFHTIKGNSAMLGFYTISDFTHKTEDLLSRIRDGKLKISKEIVDLLFKITDFVKDSIDNIANTYKDIDKADIKLLYKISTYIDKKKEIIEKKPIVKKKEPKKKKDKLNFLVVDDDYINRTVLSKALNQFGEFSIAVNGEEAVSAYMLALEEEIPFDIIFMDINMPEMDGIEASTIIRNMEKENGIYGKEEVIIIIVSGIKNPRDIIKSIYKCGATTYITKPYDVKRITRELELLKLI